MAKQVDKYKDIKIPTLVFFFRNSIDMNHMIAEWDEKFNFIDWKDVMIDSENPDLIFDWIGMEEREWHGMMAGQELITAKGTPMIFAHWGETPGYEDYITDEEVMYRFVCALMAK